MNLFHEPERIYIENEAREIVAFVTFPHIEEHTVCIEHTFVDESERGNGLAGKLMKALVKILESTKQKAEIRCSYAESWFQKHPEYAHLLAAKKD